MDQKTVGSGSRTTRITVRTSTLSMHALADLDRFQPLLKAIAEAAVSDPVEQDVWMGEGELRVQVRPTMPRGINVFNVLPLYSFFETPSLTVSPKGINLKGVHKGYRVLVTVIFTYVEGLEPVESIMTLHLSI